MVNQTETYIYSKCVLTDIPHSSALTLPTSTGSGVGFKGGMGMRAKKLNMVWFGLG